MPVGMIIGFLAAAAAPTNPVMFAGPRHGLDRLALAARTCGYPAARVSRAPFGVEVVALPAPDRSSADDRRLRCVIKWVLTHSEEEIAFVGNEAVRP